MLVNYSFDDYVWSRTTQEYTNMLVILLKRITSKIIAACTNIGG